MAGFLYLKGIMRIWHETLVPKLCRQHLLAQWREGLGCLKAVMGETKGYINHPQTKAYRYAPNKLLSVLELTRAEMINRGYNPKPIPNYPQVDNPEDYREWQSLKEQIKLLKAKECKCSI